MTNDFPMVKVVITSTRTNRPELTDVIEMSFNSYSEYCAFYGEILADDNNRASSIEVIKNDL